MGSRQAAVTGPRTSPSRSRRRRRGGSAQGRPSPLRPGLMQHPTPLRGRPGFVQQLVFVARAGNRASSWWQTSESQFWDSNSAQSYPPSDSSFRPAPSTSQNPNPNGPQNGPRNPTQQQNVSSSHHLPWTPRVFLPSPSSYHFGTEPTRHGACLFTSMSCAVLSTIPRSITNPHYCGSDSCYQNARLQLNTN